MTEDTDIHQLDEDTVARIAAGEVVERPASAVKELVENSLDADASRVDVTVEAGGTDLIRVADDGRGMTEADLRAAVRQHTTSKIRGLEDLESGVATLGFRGEALHTIGSVSRMTIRSRPRGGSEAGTELVYEGGEVTSVEPAGCPEGTTVEVEDLFYNTPARRKFLKTTATEFAHVNRVVTRYALANPDVAVSLTHDGREVFATTGQGDLQAAVLAVYGREVAASMIPVEADADDLPPGPLESVSGLVSHPETNRSSREYLATYVNGRAVTADAIREGIMGAYGGQLGGDRYPFVTLFLEVPGDAVDVNVHPRKREVRFDDDDSVRRQVDAAVETALLEHGLLRSRAPRGRSAPGEARVEPNEVQETLDGSRSASTDGDEPKVKTDDGRTSAGERRESAGRDAADPTSASDADRTDGSARAAGRVAESPDQTDAGDSGITETSPRSGSAAPSSASVKSADVTAPSSSADAAPESARERKSSAHKPSPESGSGAAANDASARERGESSESSTSRPPSRDGPTGATPSASSRPRPSSGRSRVGPPPGRKPSTTRCRRCGCSASCRTPTSSARRPTDWC